MRESRSVEGRPPQRPPFDVRTVRRLAAPAIIALALASSLTSMGNGFAFDDLPIIAQDGRIHRLEEPWRFFTQPYWGPPARAALYRPLTSLGFALQWNLGGGSPLPYHLMSLLLYASVSLVVYGLASELLGRTAGWWSAALFAVHPVHAEAVANGVGQSELWSGLFVVTAILCYIRWRKAGGLTARRAAILSMLYLSACLFKEHAIVLPALLAIAEVTVSRAAPAPVSHPRDLLVLGGALGLTALGFWTAHVLVTGRLAGDYPSPVFWGMTRGDRLFTMLGIVPEWLRLLLVPARLKVEYLPQEIHRAFAFGAPQLLGAALMGGIATAAALLVRRRPAFSFGILWTAVTLLPVSNVLVPSGLVLAERTLFLPSVGAALAAGAGIAWLSSQAVTWPATGRWFAVASGAAVLIAGGLRSAVRQPVWRSHESFLTQMLLEAPDSYRSHWVRGIRLLTAHETAAGERELATAVALFPDDPQLLAQVADRYRGSNRCEAAVPFYRHSLAIDRRRSYLRERLIECLVRLDQLDEARAEVGRALATRQPGARRDSVLVGRAAGGRTRSGRGNTP